MDEDRTFVALKYDIRLVRENGVDRLHYVDLPLSFILDTNLFYITHAGDLGTRTDGRGRVLGNTLEKFIEKVIEYDRAIGHRS